MRCEGTASTYEAKRCEASVGVRTYNHRDLCRRCAYVLLMRPGTVGFLDVSETLFRDLVRERLWSTMTEEERAGLDVQKPEPT